MRGFQFVSKIFLLLAAALSYTSVEGQSSLALKNLQRQKWQRAYELLTKATAKDSLNVTAKYVLAQYFFSEDNPAFQLDSAYKHVLGALNDFHNTSQKERDKLLRFPVDSLLLHGLREQIESSAFSESKQIQSEKSWISFIARFPTSAYIPKAKQQRDSVAFEIAALENTYIAFHDFLKKYPESEQFRTAAAKYEKLLLDTKTSDQTLQSYERFLSDHPASAYRSFVEQTIFEYRTASAEYDDYVDFIRKYPNNPFVGKAKNILFYLIPERDRLQKWPSEFTTDSLAQAMILQTTYLVPFLKNNKYGFMDAKGREVIKASLDSLHARYHCGNVDDDLILLPDKVIAGTGTSVWNGPVKKFDDIGSGFLLFENEECKFLVHKSGFKVGPECIDDANILNGRLVALKTQEHWSLYTLSGRLLERDLDGIHSIKDIVCLKKNNQTRLVPARNLTTLPMRAISDFAVYDDAKPWNNNLILVRKQNQSGLLDQQLNFVVPLGESNLNPVFFGVITKSQSGFKVYSSQHSATFKNVIAQDPWLAAKDSLWKLIDPKTLHTLFSPFDTVAFFGSFPVGQRNDSSFIFFNSNSFWKGRHPASIEFIPGQDSAYLSVEEKGRKSLYNHRGEKLFTATFDEIQFAGGDAFIVQRKDKKGLISKSGKLLLPFEYDAISTMKDGVMSLLKSSKFGLYDYGRKMEIHPAYGKNLIPYNSKIVVAYRNDLYGFIGWDNKAISKFEFKEIRYWNDTTALVKKDTWMLYEIKTRSVVMDRIKDFKMIRDEPTEKLAIIYQDANHGVLHNHNGIIIPISYSDIINVGSRAEPLYFTEKHIEEASVFVVIYYDAQGQFLRKEIYDPEDYDRIYCNAN
jgi:outer membrane protein assembly factor BamD (BamD/ComL family)